MARSAFNRPRRTIRSSTPRVDETYNLKGLNMVAPDQIIPEGESPFNLNARGYARDEADTRVAVRNRKGSVLLSTPIGETLDTENTESADGDIEFDAATWIVQQFTPETDGVLTRVELDVKKVASGNGPLVIEIYADGGAGAGQLLGETSILPSEVDTDYDFIGAHLMDAPVVSSESNYWMLLKVQDEGTGTFAVSQTADSGAFVTTDELQSITPLDSTFRFKTYISTPGEILGHARRYPQNKENRTYFAMGEHVYEVNDAGTSVSIDDSVHPNAEYWRPVQIDDKLIWVDGMSSAKWYDGDDVKVMGGVAGIPTHVWVYKNRTFFVPADDPTRVNFSALYNFENYPSVNFFYVPSPKSPDHIAGGIPFQDNLVIFTHETKHTVFGSEISTFTRKEAIGTKGAVSQEAIAADRNYIYFMADDNMIYRYNGVSDEIISEKIRPLLSQIQNPKKVRFHIHDNQLRVYFAKTPNTIATEMVVFDIDASVGKDFRWWYDTGRSVMGSLSWYLNENELVEFSSRVGALYIGERGYSDAGKPIDFKYWTAYKNYGAGSAKDRIKRFRPIVRPSATPYNLMVGKDVDFQNRPSMKPWLVDSGGARWGHFVWNDGTKWGGGSTLVDHTSAMSGRGKHTQYRFEKRGVNISVEIYGYISLIKSGRPR